MNRKIESDYHELARVSNLKWIGEHLPKNTDYETKWECSKGHVIKRTYSSIYRSRKCTKCSGRAKIVKEDYIDLALQLNFQWQGPLPKNSIHKTNWICEKGHKFKRSYSSLKIFRSCKVCAIENRRRSPEEYKALALKIGYEWLGPPVTTTKHKTNWRCNHGHKFLSIYNTLQQGSRCPKCNYISTSRIEIRVLTELQTVFTNVKWRYKHNGIETDLYLPDINIAIEIDGSHWHRDKEQKDTKKNKQLKKLGINLYRLREIPLNKIEDRDICFYGNKGKLHVIKELLNKILINNPSIRNAREIKRYLISEGYRNTKTYNKLLSNLPNPSRENSLAERNPKIASEWDYIKNEPLTPIMFTGGSNKIVFWKCSKGHQYGMSIQRRTSLQRGCPYCSGERLLPETSFAEFYPELITEWHPTKNKNSPKEYTPHSAQKVWWKCKKGHEWDMPIGERTSKKPQGCPYCSGKRVAKSESFKDLHPDLAREWHPTKNKMQAHNYAQFSGYRAWWKCKKGHEWQIVISARTSKKTKCPYCSGKRVVKGKSFQDLFPDIAKEWHPTLNEKNPEEYAPHSNKKVWWKCKKGHEWDMRIGQRTSKKPQSCPFCAGVRVAKGKSFQDLFPDIAKEWHTTKNEKSPNEYRPHSNYKAWWQCKQGHEWKVAIGDRVYSKTKCPYCAGKRVASGKNLQDVYPDLVLEWHPTKNKKNPYEYMPHSGQKVWWLCESGHEWKAQISSRTSKKPSGCPYCVKKRVANDMRAEIL